MAEGWVDRNDPDRYRSNRRRLWAADAVAHQD